MHEQGSTISPSGPIPSNEEPLFPCAGSPKAALPNVGDPFLVLCFPGPDGNLVPLGADVDDGPAHLVAVLIKHLPNEAQQLLGGDGEPGTVPTGAQPWGRGNTTDRSLEQGHTHSVQPEPVQLGVPLLLGQGDEPAPTTLVLAVLPHGLNAILGVGKGTVRATKYPARAGEL